ncbi:MAG: carbohydrate-binding protein, partial [Planctomycetota bacterium]
MKTGSCLPWRRGRSTSTVRAAACLAVWIVALATARAEAGSFVIPAWSFARGNGRIHANPARYADAGPVAAGGPRRPWGWSLAYDVEFPVSGVYRLHIKYASAEARPIEVFYDARNVGKCCTGISLSSGPAAKPTWKSSGARWELLRNRFGGPAAMAAKRNGKAEAGTHRIMLASRGPLPHFVALRLETAEPFPEDWRPPRYKVRDLDGVRAEYRAIFTRPSAVDLAELRRPVKDPPRVRHAGTLVIPAWAFDRGNVRIYASPDEYANAEPMVGSRPGHAGRSVVEYDIDFPVAGEYALSTKYASPEARPVEVFLDGKSVGWCCNGVAFNSPPGELPIVLSGDSWDARWAPDDLAGIRATKGRHTLKLTCQGPFPHLVSLKLGTQTAFPKGWKQPPREMRQLEGVPVTERSAFLPPDAVNIPALRLAIEDTIRTYGREYPGGEGYLKRLAEFEKKRSTVSVVKPCQRSFLTSRTWAGEENLPEEDRRTEKALKSLRREAMLAHPALALGKLLFVKRKPYHAHIYEDQHHSAAGGNIYLLSPVAADCKVTRLVPELDGGLFGRFDL